MKTRVEGYYRGSVRHWSIRVSLGSLLLLAALLPLLGQLNKSGATSTGFQQYDYYDSSGASGATRTNRPRALLTADIGRLLPSSQPRSEPDNRRDATAEATQNQADPNKKAKGKANAAPHDDVYELIRMRLEHYQTSGQTDLVTRAPHCLFRQADQLAWSTGAVRIFGLGGQLYVEGYSGFEARMTNSSLTISNKVRSIVRQEMLIKTKR